MSVQIEHREINGTPSDVTPRVARGMLREFFPSARWPVSEKPCPSTVELARALEAAYAKVQEENPDSSPVMLYTLFSAELPFFTSMEIQKKTMADMVNTNPDVARAGTNAFVLMNMRQILSAAGNYFSGDPDRDFDLVHAGITHLITDIKKYPDKDRCRYLRPYIHNSIQQGISIEISHREGIPASWVMRKLHTQIIEMVTDSLDLIPPNPHENVVNRIAYEIANESGVEATAVESLIEYRVALRDSLAPREQDETQHNLEPLLDKALGNLSPRLAIVIRARNGLPAGGSVYTLEDTGKLVGVPRERARQLEGKGLRQLRFLMRSKETIQEAVQPVVETPKAIPPPILKHPINYSRLLGILIDPNKMKYRYPTLKVDKLFGFGTVFRLNTLEIYTVADLLSRNITELLANKKIKKEQISGIIATMRDFLEKDRRRKTILDQWQ